MLRGRTITQPTPAFPVKDAAETRLYEADLSQVIGAGVIVQPSVAVTPTDTLQVVRGWNTQSQVFVVLTGGIAGTTYEIAIGALLADGSYINRAASLAVVALTAASTAEPSDNVVGINGMALSIGGQVLTIAAGSDLPDGSVSTGAYAVSTGGYLISIGADQADSFITFGGTLVTLGQYVITAGATG